MPFIVDKLESEGLLDTKSYRTQRQLITVAASTLAFTSDTEYMCILIGTTAGQIIKLTNATTIDTGHEYLFHNNSTQNVTIQDFGGNFLTTLGANQRVLAVLQTNLDSNGVWSLEFTITGQGFGNGAGINFGFDGNASSGRWLESNTNVAANISGIVIPSVTFIKAITVAVSGNSTISFSVYGSTAANNAAQNMVLKTTVNLSAQRKFTLTGLNIPIAAGEELGVRVDSGSASRPVVTLYIQ